MCTENESDDVDSGRPTSRQSRASADLGTSRNSGRRGTLDQFTGDSLLHFSYSANIGAVGGMTSDSQLGKRTVHRLHIVEIFTHVHRSKIYVKL